MGAWIEIHPVDLVGAAIAVAPYMGAWIEIPVLLRYRVSLQKVAPYMGAWIEIFSILRTSLKFMLSHPTWVRGLKSIIL